MEADPNRESERRAGGSRSTKAEPGSRGSDSGGRSAQRGDAARVTEGGPGWSERTGRTSDEGAEGRRGRSDVPDEGAKGRGNADALIEHEKRGTAAGGQDPDTPML